VSWGAHVVDGVRAQAIVDAALPAAGLSAARDWRAFEAFLDPFDTEEHQRGYAFGYPNHSPPIPPQICCMKTLLAVARAAGKAGDILWASRRRDVLRTPQADGLVGASPHLARELGAQAGLLCLPVAEERPNLSPGTALCIGGDDGLPPEKRVYGGLTHGILVVGVAFDGLLDTIEGGQGPQGNAIEAKRRELVGRGGHWWVRDAGSTVPGRRLRWWYPMGDLPELDR